MKKHPIPNFQLYGSKKLRDSNRFFDIARIGLSNEKYNRHYAPHRHTRLHEILWVSAGHLSLLIDETKYAIQPDTLCIITAGAVHESTATPQVDGFVIHFSSDFLLSAAGEASAWKLANFRGLPPLAVESAETAKRLRDIFKRINTEFALKGPEQDDLICHYLNIILLEMQREANFANTIQVDRAGYLIFQRFKAQVEQHYATIKQVSEYAKLLNITPNYLNMLCKDNTGHTAGQFIRHRVILEAKRLLIFSGANVSEVAYALGYDDGSYFSRLFKKVVKLSPSAFKKRHAQL